MRILYFILFCSCISHAQETAITENGRKIILFPDRTYQYADSIPLNEKLLKREDFTFSNGRMQVDSVECIIRNQDIANTILVSVVCQEKAFNKIGIDKITYMILMANEKVRNSL